MIRYLLIFLILSLPIFSHISIETSSQMCLMLTEDLESFQGSLYLFEKDSTGQWKPSLSNMDVTLGKKGSAWGMEEPFPGETLPHKCEGDLKTPLGIFTIGTVFGYISNHLDINMPYLFLTETHEGVDDPNSQYYNQIVSREEVSYIDWNSAEKMIIPEYQYGFVINYNTLHPRQDWGSCIFFHLWGSSNSPTAGCTATSKENCLQLIHWLDQEKNPILVQLTKQMYYQLKESWNLPELKL